ncbi:MAG TPA: hypothetical protein VJZ68_02350 [Nitrososphaera sp.]|nr:hypothetical protein [Nitrososphaera sp.]
MASKISCSCDFVLSNEAGNELAKGEAQINLDGERLSILPKFGVTIHLSLVDITKILPVDYRLDMTLTSRERLSVSNLGYKFGDFVSNLFQARNEMILKYLLMNESIKKSGVWGDLFFADASSAAKQFEKCELRLYETSIVLIPTTGEPIRIHYSNVSQIEAKDYSIAITTEIGERLVISKIGRELDSTSRDLSDAINTLNIQGQSLIKNLVPSADPSVVRSASRLLKDGKAARRSDIESVSPEVWRAFEKKLEQTPISSGYQYLKSIARQEKIAIGIKRGLMDDLTGNYLWVLIPIDSKNPQLGNAISVEAARIPSSNAKDNAVSTDGIPPDEDSATATGGNATYFFRIVGRKDYAELVGKMKELDAKVDSMISRMNELMLDINFRREPIFLSDEALRTDPKYARYNFAASKIPSLRDLRQRFIGRIIHSSPEQWKSDVLALLSFNQSTIDDNAKWEKK